MLQQIGPNRKFLLSTYFLLLILFMVVLWVPKPELFLLVNTRHNEFLDSLMRMWTFLGDGLFAAIIGVLALFIRWRYGFLMLLTFLGSGLISQILKRLVFPGQPRPLQFFIELGRDIYTIPGLDIHHFNSFPSGHTTTAFALFTGIALLIRTEWLKYLCLILALGVAFSRVYLAQHFPIDVLGGSVIGIFATILFYRIVFSWKRSWLDRSPVNSLMQRRK